MDYNSVVQYLEQLTIMPKTMPGLEKIRAAVETQEWFHTLNPKKIITVAGTNGKGTTAAALQALLVHADKKVGLYTSPHLVTTRERIRINDLDISEEEFINLFLKNQDLIEKFHLSHFEALTLMAADYFFSQNLDYVIFEVGLGGLYDATNIFPNGISIIAQIGLDHENILGNNIVEIARNKFGIIKMKNTVVHHKLDAVLSDLVIETQMKTQSQWVGAKPFKASFVSDWHGGFEDQFFKTNLIGPRAIENISTAITAFAQLGYNFENHKAALTTIRWPGRMEKVEIKNILCPVYLSGDHNPQGIDSLIEILKYYKYETLHLVVGIGVDKSCDEMLQKLMSLNDVNLYLTETPFKGRRIEDYPEFAKSKAVLQDADLKNIFSQIKTNPQDIVVVTGSLYLVGEVLKGL